MLVLDTNHLREFAMGTALGERLKGRLSAAREEPVTTIATVEEVLRGRLAKVASARTVEQEVEAAERLAAATRFLGLMTVLPWDFESAARFRTLRSLGIRVGTMDLKIACITLEYDAILLTRNLVDFTKIPELRFENWLD